MIEAGSRIRITIHIGKFDLMTTLIPREKNNQSWHFYLQQNLGKFSTEETTPTPNPHHHFSSGLRANGGGPAVLPSPWPCSLLCPPLLSRHLYRDDERSLRARENTYKWAEVFYSNHLSKHINYRNEWSNSKLPYRNHWRE
jgi:hypothetical protein